MSFLRPQIRLEWAAIAASVSALCLAASADPNAAYDTITNTFAQAKYINFNAASPGSAAVLLGGILTNGDPRVKEELDRARTPDEPLRLSLASLRMIAMRDGGMYRNEEYLKEVETLVAKYHEMAKDKGWGGYTLLLDAYCCYGMAANDLGAVERSCMDACESGDIGVLWKGVNYLLSKDADANKQLVARLVKAYDATNRKPSVPMEQLRCQFSAATGGAVFAQCAAVLDRCPGMSLDETRSFVSLMRAKLDVDNSKEVAAFYRALLNFAMRQEATDERLPVIAYVLNEKKKMDSLLPELKSVETNITEQAKQP